VGSVDAVARRGIPDDDDDDTGDNDNDDDTDDYDDGDNDDDNDDDVYLRFQDGKGFHNLVCMSYVKHINPVSKA
jgi:hypothetical protein